MDSKSLAVYYWREWHVRAGVLASMLLQWLLLLLVTFRKRTANSLFNYLIYVVHLLSTKVAFATFYYIVGAQYFKISRMPFGLWAAVMALHMAGQERLTAFSLEDNDLWRSSTLTIYFQILVHLIIIPKGNLPIPTLIMLCFAVWRIGYRGFRLRMGTKEMMLSWVFPPTPPQMTVDVDADDDDDDDDDSQVVKNAHSLLKSSSLYHIADFGCTSADMRQVRKFFTNIKNPEHAIRIAEIELNFIYESFHTDGTIRKHLNNNGSLLYASLRIIESLFCVAALAFYIIESSTYPHSGETTSLADKNVTNLLLLGTVLLELLSYIMTVFSDWTVAALRGIHYRFSIKISKILYQLVPQRRRWWSTAQYQDYVNAPVRVRFARYLFRRWSETISRFNFLRCSIQTSSLGPISRYSMWLLDELTGTQNLITRFKFVSQEWYPDRLGKYVVRQLQQRETNIIASLKARWPDDDSYRIEVMVWHIATELLFLEINTHLMQKHLIISKLLSDHMAYLLFMKPHFFPKTWKNPLVDQEYIRKIAERINERSFEDRLKRCCQEILSHSKEVSSGGNCKYVEGLSPAINKAIEFRNKYAENRKELWITMSKEWVDILVFAASKYDKLEHVRGLCQGGDLITIVWLLAFHLQIIH